MLFSAVPPSESVESLCRSAEMVKEEMAEDMGASQQEAACASDSASSATGH